MSDYFTIQRSEHPEYFEGEAETVNEYYLAGLIFLMKYEQDQLSLFVLNLEQGQRAAGLCFHPLDEDVRNFEEFANNRGKHTEGEPIETFEQTFATFALVETLDTILQRSAVPRGLYMELEIPTIFSVPSFNNRLFYALPTLYFVTESVTCNPDVHGEWVLFEKLENLEIPEDAFFEYFRESCLDNQRQWLKQLRTFTKKH